MGGFALRMMMTFSNMKRMHDYFVRKRKPCHVSGCGLLSVISFYCV